MFCAPTPEWSATLAAAPGGAAGIFNTVGIIRRLIDEGKTQPVIIDTAVRLIYLAPERDECSEIDAIHAFVRDSVRYVRDVVGVETLATPEITLQRRAGDCDDQTALLGALLESAGYPTRLVIAAYNRPGVWEHIYLQALCNGEWINLDPTEHMPMGYAPPDALSLWVESR